MSRISAFFDEMRGKKIAFIGVGVSHTDLIKLFLSKGLDVTVCDRKSREEMKEYGELSALGAGFDLGGGYLDKISAGEYDVIFRTPGMYFNSPALTAARQMGSAVTSEMEVFFDLCPCPIFALTGSDGKTTTTKGRSGAVQLSAYFHALFPRVCCHYQYYSQSSECSQGYAGIY